MNRPPIIYIVIALLFGYGIYGLWGVYEIWVNYRTGDPVYIAFTLLSLVAGCALYFRKKWSQYLIYVLSFSLISFWLYIIFTVVEDGWPYSSILKSFISLMPGSLFCAMWLGSSIVVYRYFDEK